MISSQTMESGYNWPRVGMSVAGAGDIVIRIEAVALSFLRNLSASQLQAATELPKTACAQKDPSTAEPSDVGEAHDIAAVNQGLLGPIAHSSVARSARLLAIMHSIVKMHADGRYVTLRQLYYSHISIAQHQRVIDRGVAALTQYLQVPREALRITSTAKCIVRGPIIIQERTGKMTVRRGGLVRLTESRQLMEWLSPIVAILWRYSTSYPASFRVQRRWKFQSRGHLVSPMGLAGVGHAAPGIRFVLVSGTSDFRSYDCRTFPHAGCGKRNCIIFSSRCPVH